MKKLVGLFLFLSHIAFGLNFYGVGSLNGLNGVQAFAAPASGVYFLNGQLNIALLSQNGNTLASSVFVVVSKNGAAVPHNVNSISPVLLYVGVAGATGFQIPQISLVTNDTVNVQLFSGISGSGIQGGGDASFNAVTGQMYFGNTF